MTKLLIDQLKTRLFSLMNYFRMQAPLTITGWTETF